jgi:5-methylcytosine-specific restriction enzyme A
MSRAVEEWIGKHDDAKVPPRVRLRILEREKGICHLSGRKITPADQWDLDHKVALINGGEHRESNLFPALRDKHREKTAEDVAEKSRTARVRMRHLGIRQPKKPFPKRAPYLPRVRQLYGDLEETEK